MKKALLVLFAIIALLAGCDAFISGSLPSGGETPTCAVYNRGRYAQFGGKIFYVLNETLRMMNRDGSARGEITAKCTSITDVTAKYIYYADRYTLYRVLWDGSGKEQLEEDCTVSDAPGYAGQWIYYYAGDGSTLHRMTMDGARKETVGEKQYIIAAGPGFVVLNAAGKPMLLSDDSTAPLPISGEKALDACCYGNELYIALESGLIRYDGKTETARQLTRDPAFSILADDGFVYYINKTGALCSLSKETGTQVTLTDAYYDICAAFVGEFDRYAVRKGWAYFLGKDDQRLYRVAAAGGKPAVLTDTPANMVHVTDDAIFYLRAKYTQDSDMISIGNEPGFVRMKPDGSSKKHLNYPNEFVNAALIGSYLYTIETADQRGAYRVTKDGAAKEEMNYEETQRLINADTNVRTFGSLKFYLKNEGPGILCSNIDGSGEFLISKRTGVEYQYVDGWLYFSYFDGLFRTRREWNGDCECLVQAEGIMDFTIQNNKIFYKVWSADQSIYSINTDGTGRTRLTADYARLIGVEDGWVYYMGESFDSIYRIRPDGSENECLAGDLSGTGEWVLSDGWIYYSKSTMPERFCRLNCRTGEKQQLAKHSARIIRANGRYIYWIADSNSGIYRYSKETGEMQCIVPDMAEEFNLDGDYLYYLVTALETDAQAVRVR